MNKGTIIHSQSGVQVVWGRGMNARQSKVFTDLELLKKFAKENKIKLGGTHASDSRSYYKYNATKTVVEALRSSTRAF